MSESAKKRNFERKSGSFWSRFFEGWGRRTIHELRSEQNTGIFNEFHKGNAEQPETHRQDGRRGVGI
jgi:hypothetical protein